MACARIATPFIEIVRGLVSTNAFVVSTNAIKVSTNLHMASTNIHMVFHKCHLSDIFRVSISSVPWWRSISALADVSGHRLVGGILIHISISYT